MILFAKDFPRALYIVCFHPEANRSAGLRVRHPTFRDQLIASVPLYNVNARSFQLPLDPFQIAKPGDYLNENVVCDLPTTRRTTTGNPNEWSSHHGRRHESE